MNVCAVITARLKSTRLPNKALLDVEGKVLLQRVVDRARQSLYVEDVIVATTFSDYEIQDYCKNNHITYNLGETDDILGRIYEASRLYDIVVRVWGDCPLVSPEIIDKLIVKYTGFPDTYCYNAGYPTGLNVAVIGRDILEQKNNEISDPKDREWFHVYMMKQKTSILYNRLPMSEINLSVNTQDDMDFIRKAYQVYGEDCRWENAIELLAQGS